MTVHPITQAPPDEAASSTLEGNLAIWLRNRERSFLRRMVSLVAKPGMLSMAGGLPEPSLFPAEELGAAYGRLLREDPRALQYGSVSERLKEQVVALAARRGIQCRAEEVIITTGAQQGIDVSVRSFMETGGSILLDELSYTGIHQTGAPHHPEWLEVPVDLAAGSDPDAARAILRARRNAGKRPPELAYLISDGHNPLGLSISEERRQAWAELLGEQSIPLIEDDPYGLVWFDEEFPPSLKSRIPEWTVYLGSFSKILAPGLRLGFMIVPAHLTERIGVVKESEDLECSGLTQRAVSEVLDGGNGPGPNGELGSAFLDDHLTRVRSLYKERRDALLEALDRHLSGKATWTRPRGGMFAWVEFNEDVLPADAAGATKGTVDLLQRCIEGDQVAFLPGEAFALPGGRAARRARRSMRLSFSSLKPEVFDGAIAAIHKHL